MIPSLTVIGEVTDYLIVVEITLIMRIWQTNNKLYQSFHTELRLSSEYTLLQGLYSTFHTELRLSTHYTGSVLKIFITYLRIFLVWDLFL